jgi:hypothetical protein
MRLPLHVPLFRHYIVSLGIHIAFVAVFFLYFVSYSRDENEPEYVIYVIAGFMGVTAITAVFMIWYIRRLQQNVELVQYSPPKSNVHGTEILDVEPHAYEKYHDALMNQDTYNMNELGFILESHQHT